MRTKRPGERSSRAFSKIRPEDAVRLYAQEGLSLREAGRRLGCSSTTVRDALKVQGLVLRPVGDVDGKGGWGAFQRRRQAR